MIVASGFSCQEQIAQLTDRHALYLAHVLQLALKPDATRPGNRYPERFIAEEREHAVRQSMVKAGASLGAVMAGIGTLWFLGHSARRQQHA